jgi:hypothetical protein
MSCLLVALASAAAMSQEMSAADAARVKAAMVIATYDELAARCEKGSGFTGVQRAELDRWESSQQVSRVRTHVQGPGLSPAVREQVQAAARQIIQQVAATGPPCIAAVSITRTNDAQFSGQLAPLLAGATNLPAASKPSAASMPPASRPPAPVSTGNAAKLAADIEGFAFDNCTRIGYGGMVLLVPCPVVLFRNGNALTDVEGLNHPQGLAGHRAKDPESWTQWRRSGGQLQLKKPDGWEKLGYDTLYSALPKGFRLDGRYHSANGTGNTAMGGGQAVIAWSDYLFSPDGRVQRDGGAGASSTGTGVSVTSMSSAASRTGRYRIEGLILAIDYDDGSRERRVIIADPKDQGKGTMWLDGEGYVYKK